MRAWIIAIALAVSIGAAALVASAAHHEKEEVPPIQVVTTLIGGKNVFIPSTLVVAEGVPHKLSIFNTTDKPHGFRIPQLGIEAILPSQEEQLVALPALDPGIYRIVCHLHPPHRTATLVVLD